MAITIRIKSNNDDSSEAKAAAQVKKILEKELSQISKYSKGEILIISNVTLFGQETKDIDIIMIGKLENLKLQITSETKDKSFTTLPVAKRETYLNSFCYVIELKEHSHSGVKQDGLNLLVKYNQKWSDATSQSEKQKYALMKYFNEQLGFSPSICNFIWLRNISSNELVQLNQNRKDNLLPSSFSLIDIVTKSTYQFAPFKPENQSYCTINCVNLANKDLFDLKRIHQVFNLFSEIRMASGDLTRKKIEQITSATLDKQQYAQDIGKKLTIIAGRAGTGKTVRLLRIACDLAVNKGSRSLILTYNHALVSDIRRVFLTCPPFCDMIFSYLYISKLQ